jgi:hypothetical protein
VTRQRGRTAPGHPAHGLNLNHQNTMTTSSLGSPRARRREKSQLDLDTQRALWVQRLRDLVADGNTAFQALDRLAGEVPTWIDEIPARKAQRRDAWNAFLREVRAATKP